MTKRSVGFALGVFLFALVLVLPVPEGFTAAAREMTAAGGAVSPAELAASMRSVLALTLLMVVWWVTEAVPLSVTALLPAVLLPLLQVTGADGLERIRFTLHHVGRFYAHPVIFLFLGGFLLAAAMRKWKLDRRLTLYILTRGRLAEDSRKALLAMMGVSAFLSMWISNTAATALMLPLALGLLSLAGSKPGESRFGTAVMLGVAYAASIGGMATIIGTPVNGVALGILHTALGGTPGFREIRFLDWLSVGLPYVAVFLPVAWFALIRIYPPETPSISGGRARLLGLLKELGPLSRAEKYAITVFISAATLWIVIPFRESLLPAVIARQLAWLDEYTIGILAGVSLFLIPAGRRDGSRLLEWTDTAMVEWGVLILFGGGIALSDAMFRTGLAAWMATSFVALFGSPSTLLLMIVIVLLVNLLTEVTSNTAVTSMLVPVVISVAQATGGDPVSLTVAAALGGSLAFMLPVATPPNALVYSSGYITLKEMVKAGAVLDVLGWILTVTVVSIVARFVLGLG